MSHQQAKHQEEEAAAREEAGGRTTTNKKPSSSYILRELKYQFQAFKTFFDVPVKRVVSVMLCHSNPLLLLILDADFIRSSINSRQNPSQKQKTKNSLGNAWERHE
jgi:hypothetical protein